MERQELIKLATDKGFTSKVIGKSVDNKSTEKDFYYLWMCELQKWLRDVHRIHVSPLADYDKKDITYNTYWNSYELALEEGLFQALSI